MQDLNTRIALKFDTAANWESANPILLSGEIAVVIDGQNQLFKVGDGVKNFNDLPYSFYEQFASKLVQTDLLKAKSLSQGYGNETPGIGVIALGYKNKATSNFAQVHGHQATVSSDFGYVWNGDNQVSNYSDHGNGTFSINPISGLQGVFIGEDSLCAIFDDYYKKSETSSNVELNAKFATLSTYGEIQDQLSNDGYATTAYVDNSASKTYIQDSEIELSAQAVCLSVMKVTPDEYRQIVAQKSRQDLSSSLFVISGDVEDVMNKRIANVATPTQNTDAATKKYVDDNIKTHVSQLDNDLGFITPAFLNGYVAKTEVQPLTTTGTHIADIGGRAIYAPEGGGGGGGGDPLAPCVVILRQSNYSSGDATIGGITIRTTDDPAKFYINNELISKGQQTDGDLVFTIYVKEDDPYANTTQIFYSGSCLSYDTLISMADGTEKKICDVKCGDKVLSLNPNTNAIEEDEVVLAEVSKDRVADRYDIWTFDDGTQLKTVNRHRFYNVDLNEFMYMEAWLDNERALKMDMTMPILIKHESVNEKVWHCTLFTKKWNNYFANGLLSGNRNSEKVVVRK